MHANPSEAVVVKLTVQKIKEEVTITRSELLNMVRHVNDSIPADARLYVQENGYNDLQQEVVQVIWHRDPEPDEWERVKAGDKEEDEEEEEDEEDEDEEEEDDDGCVECCPKCLVERGGYHSKTCPFKQNAVVRVSAEDCLS